MYVCVYRSDPWPYLKMAGNTSIIKGSISTLSSYQSPSYQSPSQAPYGALGFIIRRRNTRDCLWAIFLHHKNGLFHVRHYLVTMVKNLKHRPSTVLTTQKLLGNYMSC